MSLIIHTGPSRGYYYFQESIAEYVKQGLSNYLAILPVNRAVRNLKRRLIDITPNKALIDPPVFTFDSFLILCYKSIKPEVRIIDPEMFYLFVEDILEKNMGLFRYFLQNRNLTPRTVRRISTIFSELRRNGYHANLWMEKRNLTGEMPREKFDDFHLLLKQFEYRLGKGWIDEPFAMNQASVYINQNDFEIIFHNPETLFISGYDHFTSDMIRLIKKLKQWMAVKIKLDYISENPELFRQTENAIKNFENLDASFVNPDSTHIGTRLFNRKDLNKNLLAGNKKYHIISTENRSNEIRTIAAKIKELYHYKKIKPSRIALTFPVPEMYSSQIKRIFKDFEIPFNISTGHYLRDSPLIQKYLSILEIIANDFNQEFIFNFFFSLTGLSNKNLHLTEIQKLIIQYRMEHLRPQWYKIIMAKLQKFSGFTEVEKTNIFEHLYRFNELLKLFYTLAKPLAIQDFRIHYLNILKTLDLLNPDSQTTAFLSERERESENRAFNRFIKLFEKMNWHLSLLFENLALKPEKYYRILRALISNAVYNIKEWPDYGVQIMPRLEVLAIDCDVLFMGGMVEGSFPRSSVQDMFFNDEMRSRLELPATEEIINQDRFIFYSLLELPKDQIFLTYPRLEEDRILSASTFTRELQELFDETITIESPDSDYFINKNSLTESLGISIQKLSIEQAKTEISSLLNINYNSAKLTRILEKLKSGKQRIDYSYPGIFEGNISSSTFITDILKKKYSAAAWSSTQLDDYGYCPMSFMLRRLWQIEDLPAIENEITSVEKGLVLHKILYEFYNYLKKINQTHLPLKNRDTLFDIAKQVLSGFSYEGLFWELEKQTIMGTDHKSGLLLRILELDQQKIEETGFIPAWFEFSFGRKTKGHKNKESILNPVLLSFAGKELLITGSIDRIDIHPDGRAIILDYKTGSGSTRVNVKHFLRGTHHQLPLYALAFKKLYSGSKVAYAGYFLIKSEKECKYVPAMMDSSRYEFYKNRSVALLPNPGITNSGGEPLSFDQLLGKNLETAILQVNELKQGHFHHTQYPGEEQCQKYCEFRRMCRKNTAKIEYLGGEGK